MIDNYDSFTYNLVQYFEELGEPVRVVRNDQTTLAELKGQAFRYLVISPGPGTPKETGITMQCLEHFKGSIPILGVCLGHQAIGEYFGCEVVRAPEPMHGKNSTVFHSDRGLFKGLKNPLSATRYHSLIVSRSQFSPDLTVNAWTSDDTIMGFQHVSYPIYGVQFHPEAILTEEGKPLLRNFLELGR